MHKPATSEAVRLQKALAMGKSYPGVGTADTKSAKSKSKKGAGG